MKKLKGYVAEVIKYIIREGASVFEIDGRKYYLSLIEVLETTLREDAEQDTELKTKVITSKKRYSRR